MTRHKALWAGLAVVLVVLQLALQCRAAKIARENPALGVQLAAPLTAETLTAARAWEQSDANTAGITASYWKQETDTVSTDFGRTAEGVACIGFDGTAGDCLPADYRQGTAPGAVGQQCALSTALAWALFGSADIVGQTVTMGRVDYTLCGVFDADTNILLYPAQAGFTNAALRGVSSDTPRAAAEQWAASAGVGAVKSITYGPQKVWLARMLCCLPALAVGL